MPIVDSELEIIEALDFEFETPCDGIGCDLSAKWKAMATCCGRMILTCEKCHELLVGAEGYAGYLIDYACGSSDMNLIWEKL